MEWVNLEVERDNIKKEDSRYKFKWQSKLHIIINDVDNIIRNWSLSNKTLHNSKFFHLLLPKYKSIKIQIKYTRYQK